MSIWLIFYEEFNILKMLYNKTSGRFFFPFNYKPYYIIKSHLSSRQLRIWKFRENSA